MANGSTREMTQKKPQVCTGPRRKPTMQQRRCLKNQGGGELTTKGLSGKIVSKDTISPGRDPNPPKDKEH